VPSVFASRHGDVQATLTLLNALARREPVTATAFSHSVHNAHVALFSIATGNRSMASAVAAGPDTFGAAFLEAMGAMHRGGYDRALVVVGDGELPEIFRDVDEDASPAYAVAMLLGPAGVRLKFEVGAGRPAPRSSVPDAVQFVRWLKTEGASRLTLGRRTPYSWWRLPPGDGGSAL
jgi:hypothetical protein